MPPVKAKTVRNGTESRWLALFGIRSLPLEGTTPGFSHQLHESFLLGQYGIVFFEHAREKSWPVPRIHPRLSEENMSFLFAKIPLSVTADSDG